MKYIVFLFIAIIYFSFYINCFAQDEDILTDDRDSIAISEEDTSYYGLIAIGGVGIAHSSNFWGEIFNSAPALGFGLEIPFTNAYHFSLELYGHTWFSKCAGRVPEYRQDLDSYYIRLKDSLYTQRGLSAVLKAHIGNKNSFFRISLHFGWLFLSPKDEYKGADLGIGLHFKLSKNISVALERRILSKFIPDFNGSFKETTPYIYFLNLRYKLNWR